MSFQWFPSASVGRLPRSGVYCKY